MGNEKDIFSTPARNCMPQFIKGQARLQMIRGVAIKSAVAITRGWRSANEEMLETVYDIVLCGYCVIDYKGDGYSGKTLCCAPQDVTCR